MTTDADVQDAEVICEELGLGELLKRMPDCWRERLPAFAWRTQPRDRARFLRECRMAAALSHPIVYIFGTAEIEGRLVIAVELAPGDALKDRVQAHGPLPAAEAVDAILQLIAGLDGAAAAGILHRGIKPSNCFVDSRDQVKIADFGLSICTLPRAKPTLTETDTFLGTSAFAAPEQLRGETLTSGRRPMPPARRCLRGVASVVVCVDPRACRSGSR